MKKLHYLAILGSILWVISEILEMAAPSGSTPLSMWLTSIWHFIIVFGFWAIHKSQSPNRNLLSLIGVLLLIATYLAFGPSSVMILNSPDISSFPEWLAQYPFLQIFGPLALIGHILFGISIIITRYYPNWMGYGFLIFILLAMFQSFISLPNFFLHIGFIVAAFCIISMAIFAIKNVDEKHSTEP